MVDFRLYYKWWRTWHTLPVVPWVRAAAFYRAGRFELALQQYEHGLTLHVGHPAEQCARLDLAYCYFKTRNFDHAEKHLRSVTVQVPTCTEAFLRLAKLQRWTGRPMEAAWTIRRALRECRLEADLVAELMIAVVENGGPTYLVREALEGFQKLSHDQKIEPKVVAAKAKMSLLRGGDLDRSRAILGEICRRADCPIDAYILFAEILLLDDKISHCRHELKRALQIETDNPRVLSLIAESYLRSGPFYNPDYALQLSTSACQASGWRSPREMHILAESYYHVGDRMSALVIAGKAKDAGTKLLGEYKDVKNLERLIESLSSGTQA